MIVTPLLTLAAAAALTDQSAAQVQPPPRAEPVIVRFRAGPARCDGSELAPIVREEPFPVGLDAWAPRGGSPQGAVVVRFRIASSGRPLGIRAEREAGGPPVDTSDVGAAFAAWRFARGRARRDCEVRFTIDPAPVARADPDTVFRYVAFHAVSEQPFQRALDAAAFARVQPAASDCHTRPGVRRQVYPPFERILQPAGTLSYSFMSNDIDAAGRAHNIRLLGSSGNARLDLESRRALARTRFVPGARTGCLHYFYRRNIEPTVPPTPPEEAPYRRADATCPKEEPPWAKMPPLVYPPAFNRRGIEGWAVVRFDVGPDGATRNVAVLDAEPAAEFGDHAVRIVSASLKPASEGGYAGCIVRVIFHLPRATRALPKGG